MYNSDFYPTPKAVIRKMIDGIDFRSQYVLEPSAGKGDILDYIKSGHSCSLRLAAIESDPELVAALKGKGYAVLCNDFLKFVPSSIYNVIIMNPPFSAGVDHLLHAWDILKDGQIVCLINAETIKNPYTQKRKLLLNIILEHGSYEMLGPVFKNAERKTDTEIALVRLYKTGDFSEFKFFAHTKEKVNEYTEETKNELVTSDMIEEIVATYNAAKNAFIELWRARRKIEAYTNKIHNIDAIIDNAISKETPVLGYNTFVHDIRKGFWEMVFRMTKFSSRMTKKVKTDFEKFCNENDGMEFTEENIEAILQDLIMSAGKIQEQCIIEVFDYFTAYHKENRIHIEGWKTNSQWQANRRCVLPRIVEKYSWSGDYHIYYGSESSVDDIDKAMCTLTNKNFGKIQTIVNTIKSCNKDKTGESEFFILKWYDKGTLHLYFKDELLWKRFNIAACKGKNWLPNK